MFTRYLVNFEALGVLNSPIGDRLEFLSKLENFKKDIEVCVRRNIP